MYIYQTAVLLNFTAKRETQFSSGLADIPKLSTTQFQSGSSHNGHRPNPHPPRAKPTSAAMLHRLFLHHARRRLHSSSGTSASVPLSTPTFAVFGANTGVGKTLVSAGLAAALLSSPSPSVSSVAYLKPLQTGYPIDSDARFVFSRTPALLRASSSPRATRLVASCRTLFPSPAVETEAEPLHESQEKVVTYGMGGAEAAKVLACSTVYAWREPVSPHLAAAREGMAAGDDEVKGCVEQWLLEEGVGEAWKVLETAGGVASPSASGTLQCDIYRCVQFTSCSLLSYRLHKHASLLCLMLLNLDIMYLGPNEQNYT